ncbi:unnamed protein product [Periconia digitata]|uniref:Secreted protein n=1 Tax=Periconia digitata TaxID=1303443 RepID=A0A9W4XGY1_9PLEO|nr:unnamed protein product [Periconia digitata]
MCAQHMLLSPASFFVVFSLLFVFCLACVCPFSWLCTLVYTVGTCNIYVYQVYIMPGQTCPHAISTAAIELAQVPIFPPSGYRSARYSPTPILAPSMYVRVITRRWTVKQQTTSTLCSLARTDPGTPSVQTSALQAKLRPPAHSAWPISAPDFHPTAHQTQHALR